MLQGGEVLIILLVALVVLGPTRLPDLARKAGSYAAELRKAAREVRAGLEAEVGDIKSVREDLTAIRDDVKAVGGDLKKPLDEVKKPLDEIGTAVDEVGVSRLDWTGPKPVSGPTPEDAMRDYEEIERKRQQGDAEAEE